MSRRVVLLVVLTIALMGGSRAHAQCGGYGGFAGYGLGYWDIGRLYGLLEDNVPHYAAFPPVYYSVPVPRTYGYSPFAYPPGVMTPEVEVSEPLIIDNPYMELPEAEAAEEAPAPADRSTSAPRQATPLVILNPHVRAPQDGQRSQASAALATR